MKKTSLLISFKLARKAFLFSILLSCHYSKAQNIQFGQPADEVRKHIEWYVRDFYNHAGNTSMTMKSQVGWSNGHVAEVILEKDNVNHMAPDRRIVYESYQTRYIMANGKVVRILTEYFNVSLSQLKKQREYLYPSFKGVYFTNDFSLYSTAYVGKNGLATQEYFEISKNKLASDVYAFVQRKRAEIAGVSREIIPFNLTIYNNSVGDFTVGKKIAEIVINPPYKIVKTLEKKHTEEGTISQPFYNLGEGEELILKITPQYDEKTHKYSDRIGEVMIYSSRCTTTHNIGVGSSLEDFIGRYQDYKLWYTYVSDRFIIESRSLKDVQFEIDKDAFIGKESELNNSVSDSLSIKDFNLQSKIKAVRVF